MNKDDLTGFMKTHGLTQTDLAALLGVTYMATQHWLQGRRQVSLQTARLLRLFDRHPELMQEFVQP